jgi:adenylate cyclase
MTDQTPGYQRFFAELKRRRVFRLMAVYGAVAFGVLQAADVLIPALHLPESMITAIAALSLLGFPIAIALAWVFDRTPDGLTRTPEAETAEITTIVSQPAGSRWPAGIAAVVGTALLVSGVWWVIGRADDSAAPAAGAQDGSAAAVAAAPGAMAVLPFVNMSGDPENEYFSDGLSEELINALVMVDGLKVVARTSAFAFRGQERDVREIGAELGVEHVLEGSVRKAGNRVRITAQLIHAEDGFHLWSETYDRQLDDIFAVQEEIATAISEQLELTFTPEDRSTLARRRTDDLEAYDLYLLGRHNWATRLDEGLLNARRYFEAAIERDSAFAPAWAGLAAVYDALPWYTDYPADEGAERGKQAARTAIALDPSLAEAHAALGVILYEFDWDWAGAAVAFDDMQEADPDYAQGLNWECSFLASIGEIGESLPLCRRAVELDPLFMHNHNILGFTLAVAGYREEALTSYERAIELQPEQPELRLDYAVELLAANRFEEAVGAYEIWLGLEGLEDPSEIRIVVEGVKDPAQQEAARATLRRLEDSGRIRPFHWIHLWAELGDVERAIELLETAYAERDPYMINLGVAPRFESIRHDPRVIRMIQEMGLPVGLPGS